MVTAPDYDEQSGDDPAAQPRAGDRADADDLAPNNMIESDDPTIVRWPTRPAGRPSIRWPSPGRWKPTFTTR